MEDLHKAACSDVVTLYFEEDFLEKRDAPWTVEMQLFDQPDDLLREEPYRSNKRSAVDPARGLRIDVESCIDKISGKCDKEEITARKLTKKVEELVMNKVLDARPSLERRKIQFFPLTLRENGTVRPNRAAMGLDNIVEQWTNKPKPKSSFKKPLISLFFVRSTRGTDTEDGSILLFKYFDFEAQSLHYVGSGLFNLAETKLKDLQPILCMLADLPAGEPLVVVDEEHATENKLNMLQHNDTLTKMEIIRGDILCFQKSKNKKKRGQPNLDLISKLEKLASRRLIKMVCMDDEKDPKLSFRLERFSCITTHYITRCLALRFRQPLSCFTLHSPSKTVLPVNKTPLDAEYDFVFYRLVSDYSQENFVNPVDENFVCSICSNVLLKPHSCKKGHVFCYQCISSWIAHKPTCPVDREPLDITGLTPVLVLDNFISKMQVRCENATIVPDLELEIISEVKATRPKKRQKTVPDSELETLSEAAAIRPRKRQKPKPQCCKWTGALRDRKRHLDKECTVALVPCSFRGCLSLIERSQLKRHEDNCSFRRIGCPHCRTQQFTDHVCDLEPIACPFKALGCNAKGLTRRTFGKHQAAFSFKHAELVSKRILSLEGHVDELKKKLSSTS